ncbi:MAG: Cys-tRNA(Pro) deacylase [Eggerthellaceae bacterium]|nr:Cys-tRNA(Pro) deacylase [Eggerthellaceae bacterium]
MSLQKTNAMRILDQAHIPYEVIEIDASQALSGKEAAHLLHASEDEVFKTLVTRGKSGQYYVFMVPVSSTLSVKKAAKVCGEKSIEMIAQKELFPLTGYIHGGCSPLGMKKQFLTYIDETAQLFEKIFCSAGKIGLHLCIDPNALTDVLPLEFADICEG